MEVRVLLKWHTLNNLMNVPWPSLFSLRSLFSQANRKIGEGVCLLSSLFQGPSKSLSKLPHPPFQAAEFIPYHCIQHQLEYSFKNLQWLPTSLRIKFKLLAQVSQHDLGPAHLLVLTSYQGSLTLLTPGCVILRNSNTPGSFPLQGLCTSATSAWDALQPWVLRGLLQWLREKPSLSTLSKWTPSLATLSTLGILELLLSFSL